ncbi:hypothetical protein M0802_006431 [Mischocyttarus mexicanus]|nr:hypothetical protein M0802_006431 [Mischocyttarus mexicanus]
MAGYVSIEGFDSPFGVSEVCSTSVIRRKKEKGDSFHGGGAGGEVEGMEKGQNRHIEPLVPGHSAAVPYSLFPGLDGKSRRVANSQAKYSIMRKVRPSRKGLTEQKQTPSFHKSSAFDISELTHKEHHTTPWNIPACYYRLRLLRHTLDRHVDVVVVVVSTSLRRHPENPL